MRRQLAEQVDSLGVDEVWMIDVGGDAIGAGDETGLRTAGGVTLTWHPSEATALLVAAALGARGRVEIRNRGLGVTSPDVHRVDVAPLVATTAHVRALTDTSTLDEAEGAKSRIRGTSEIDYERSKAVGLGPRSVARRPRDGLRRAADTYLAAAHAQGVDHLTFRRLAEALDAAPADVLSLHADVAAAGPQPGPALPLRRTTRRIHSRGWQAEKHSTR
jgi:hypothetical protein